MAHLLEQNYLILNQYKQNMQQYKVHENTELLVSHSANELQHCTAPFYQLAYVLLTYVQCQLGEQCSVGLIQCGKFALWVHLHFFQSCKYCAHYTDIWCAHLEDALNDNRLFGKPSRLVRAITSFAAILSTDNWFPKDCSHA